MFIEKSLTISGAIKSGTHLRKLAMIQEVGDKGMVSVLIFLLIRIQEYFNVKNKLSDSQCGMLAFDILEKYGTETIEDIVIMLKKARQGDFGTSYNKIDSETIFTIWMPQYLELKAIEREKMHREQKAQAMVSEKVEKKGLETWQSIKKSLKEKKSEPVERILTEEHFVIQLKETFSYSSDQDLELKMKDFKTDPVRNKRFIKVIQDEIERRKK